MGAGEVLREHEWHQFCWKNDARALLFLQTRRPNVDSGLMETLARMVMRLLLEQNHVGTIRVPFVLSKI